MKSGVRIEEGILLIAILLNALDFFELLPGDVVYVTKLMSVTVLASVLYNTGLSEIFFGERRKFFDASIILSYFLFMLKEPISYASVIIEETHYFKNFFAVMLSNSQLIEFSGLIAGGIVLLLFSLYIALRVPFREPSLLRVLHPSEYPERRLIPLLRRFLTSYVVLVAFFLIFFNLFMEWLALAVDTPLVMAAVFIYFFIVVISRKFSSEGFLYEIGSLGENFYDKFIHLFQRRETIMLGISGMLVLHLVTDIANFLLPLTFGFQDTLYFKQLGGLHQPLYALFSQQVLAATNLGETISIAWIYMFNLLGMLMLLLLPAMLWYYLFRDKPLHVPRFALFIFYISLICFVFAPVFSLTTINQPEVLVGVDIQTHLFKPLFNFNPILIIGISFAGALMVLLLSLFHRLKMLFIGVASAVISAFFGWYIALFFIDQINYYAHVIPELFAMGSGFIGAQLFFFLVILVLFYTSGYFITLWEIFKEVRTSD